MAPNTPIVFLHAFPLDRTMWAAQTAALAGRPVLAPNMPGFGGRQPVEPSLDDFASAVVEDMDAEGIDNAVVVGLSIGGYVAFRLLSGWPERSRRALRTGGWRCCLGPVTFRTSRNPRAFNEALLSFVRPN